MVYVEYYTTATDGSLIEAMGDRSVVILDGRNSLQTMKLDAVFHNGRYRPFYKAYRICKGRTFCDSKPITDIIPLTNTKKGS